MGEKVFCLNNSDLKLDVGNHMIYIELERGFFVDRNLCETDESLKQIIPYVKIIDESGFRILSYRRKGTESRLNGLRSIGFGGHMIERDPMACLFRELHEELYLDNVLITSILYCGTIYDDSSPVGRVHLGLYYEVIVNNLDRIEGKERPVEIIDDLSKTNKDEFETWSQMIGVWR